MTPLDDTLLPEKSDRSREREFKGHFLYGICETLACIDRVTTRFIISLEKRLPKASAIKSKPSFIAILGNRHGSASRARPVNLAGSLKRISAVLVPLKRKASLFVPKTPLPTDPFPTFFFFLVVVVVVVVVWGKSELVRRRSE